MIVITFSAAVQWWYCMDTLLWGQIVLVLIDKFMNTDKKRNKYLCALGILIAGLSYVFVFYPAWQLSFGYLFLTLVIWILIKNIKYRNYKFNKHDIAVIIITIIALVYITPLLICTKVDQNYDENKYYEIEKNENPYPGSKSDFSSTYEYLPSNGYNNLVYLFERSRNPEFLIGPGAITEVQIDRFNNYIFHVENFGTNILKIEMPMVYYLGYEVTFEGENLGYEE